MTNKFITVLCACLIAIAARRTLYVRRNTKMYLLKRPLRRLSRHLWRKLRRLLRKMLRVYLWRSTLTHWPKL